MLFTCAVVSSATTEANERATLGRTVLGGGGARGGVVG
jgi:hypothetical protein